MLLGVVDAEGIVDFGQSLGKGVNSPSLAGGWFLQVTSRSMLAGGKEKSVGVFGWISQVS